MSSVRRRAPRVSKDCPRSPLGGSPTVCRACLRLERNMSELFLSSGDEDSIKDKVEFCTGLEISETDDLPNHICQTCLILLDSAYQFKTTCLYSDTTLRRKLIKTEPFEQHQGTCNNDTIVHSLYNARCKTNNGDASEKDCLSMQIIGEDDLSAKKTTNDCLMANITNASLLSAQIINEDHISAQIINTDLLSTQITDKHLTSKRTNRDRITARAMKKVRSSSSRKKECRKTKHETEHDKTVNRNDASLNDFPIKLEVKIEQDVNDDDSRYDGASDDSDDVLKDVKLRKCATTRKLQSSEQSSNKKKPAEPLKPERLLTRSRPLWCETCQVKFLDKAAFMEHRKQHQAEDTALSFVCEICGKIFKHRSSHFNHQRSHLPPEFSCQQCNYVTWHKTDLEKHKSTHTGLKRYKCELCPCAYNCSSNLHSHIRRIHERRRDHTCPICQHKFFDRRKMQQHIDSHNDIKRYSCEICGTGLSRRNYWTRHMLRQHGVVVETPRPGRHKTNLVIAEKKPPEELSVNAECDKIAT